MPFPVTCPGCNARMSAPDEVAGKRIKCKKCGETFVAEKSAPPEEQPARPAPRKPARSDDRDDEDAPRRPSRKAAQSDADYDDGEDGPRRRFRDEEEDEEEDRPRSRKEKEADKPVKANPLLVLVLTFGGLILSAALVFGSYYFLKEKETKNEPIPRPENEAPGMKGVDFKGGQPFKKGGIPQKG